MRLAIFSDVHGNVRAFEAVLAEIKARGSFDRVIVGGDLASGGPRPREAMDLLMLSGYPAILGNTDASIAGIGGDRGGLVAWARRQLKQVRDGLVRRRRSWDSVFAWARLQLKPGHDAFLRHLPTSYRVEPPGGPPLVVVHATPTSLSDMLEPDAPASAVARIFDQARARAFIYGHIHRPYVREVADGLVVNSGSVGFPFDGIPNPSFAICELTGGRWRGEIVRLSYDYEAVAKELIASDHPDGTTFARRLRAAHASA